MFDDDLLLVLICGCSKFLDCPVELAGLGDGVSDDDDDCVFDKSGGGPTVLLLIEDERAESNGGGPLAAEGLLEST